MKKLYVFLFSFMFLVFPLQALAVVDITVKDNSTTTLKNVSISIDTGTDTLEKIVVALESSADVTITEVNTGTITCSSFDYTELTNITKITCELNTATALDGVLANILFTSTGTEYSFKILDNADLNIGELELGSIVNVGEVAVVDSTVEDTTLTTESTSLVTAQQTTETTGFSMDKLTEYLPYILIAGSVVLLISIIGILLSKRKDSRNTDISSEELITNTPLDNQSTDSNDIPKTVQELQTEPTLKDIVNNVEKIPGSDTPTVVEQNITTPLDTFSPILPTQQPSTSTNIENQDLQDILKSESPNIQPETTTPVAPAVPFTSNLDVNTTPIQTPVATMTQRSTSLNDIMPETPPVASPEELQRKINEQIGQIPTTQPVTNTPVTPIQDTSTEELPPVPPTM